MRYSVDQPPLAAGFQTPEAPRWHDCRFWFSDIRAGRVFSMAEDGGDLTLVAEFDEPCSGIGFTTDGTPLVTLMKSRQIVRVDVDAGPSIHADLTHLGGAWVNDMATDRYGRCYVDQLSRPVEWGRPKTLDDGARLIPFVVDNLAVATPDSIVLVEAGGASRVIAHGLRGPNGIAVSPAGDLLVVAEYHAGQVTSFRIDAVDGSLSGRVVLFKLPEGQPDGLCLDEEGGVWCAVPAAGACVRISSHGEITDTARPLAGVHPMACVLGGDDGRTLLMTTNCRPQPTAGYVEGVRVAVAGPRDPAPAHASDRSL